MENNAHPVLAQVAPKRNPGRPRGGIREAARQLGLSRDDVRRAIKVASLSKEAQAAAVALGLDNNRTALLFAAEKREPAEQVDALHSWAEPGQSEPRVMKAWKQIEKWTPMERMELFKMLSELVFENWKPEK